MRNLNLLFIAIIVSAFILPPFSYSQDELEYATIKIGDKHLAVEIAADHKARERGLMFREEISEGTGMLFVYPRPTIIKLWMKNTYIPLSTAFIDEDGKITQILQMENVDSTKIYKSKENAKYALEVPLSWFKKNDIKIGDHCLIPPISSK